MAEALLALLAALIPMATAPLQHRLQRCKHLNSNNHIGPLNLAFMADNATNNEIIYASESINGSVWGLAVIQTTLA